jgi:methyl-accepting chemotaxis protein
VTQQNAAMVEEANAAGATLANEAGRLRELIGGFQLGDADASVTYGGGNSYSPAPVAARSVPVRAATAYTTPVASPARSMVGKIANAFRGKSNSPAATNSAADSWEEF